MKGRALRTSGRNTLPLTLTALLLGGCLTGETVDDDDQGSLGERRISGSVGDGPVAGATMRIVSKDAEILAEFESNTTGSYDITIEANNGDYPLFVSASNGTDLVTNLPPDFILRGAALAPNSQTVANVNPFTTLAIEIARDMEGGLTRTNIENAEAIIVAAASTGLSTLAGTGPLDTRIDDGNIAEIVKASESLSEIVRRTRDLLRGAGYSSQGDLVLSDVGSDLVDSVVDGRGGPRSDARTAALSTVVGAVVLLEAMANELHVNGINATAAMTAAIDQAAPGSPNPTLGELTATAGMIEGARVGVHAAYAVIDDPAIAELGIAIAGLQPGMEPVLVRSILPDDYRTRLDAVLQMIANGGDSVLETVNDVARTGDNTIDPPNQAPTINGTPDDSVQVGVEYTFTPNASDPDGDALTFSIVNRPAWLTFNAATGGLQGTPASADRGSYLDIVIEVTDGEFTDSLGPFQINVLENNAPPTISGDGSATLDPGQPYDFTPTAGDPEGDPLTFTVVNQPSWTSFDPATGQLSGTPAAGDAGSYTGIIIRVSDGELITSLPAFTITVVPPNRAPTIGGTPDPQAEVGVAYSFLPDASDPDGDTLSFTITNAPGWASFNTSNGRLSGTPGASHIGEHAQISITVTDGEFSDALGPFSITVVASNDPPTIGGTPDPDVMVGQNYSFTPTSGDPDGDTLTFSVSGLPSWADFDTATGTLSGTPAAGDVGNYSGITITVSDGTESASLGPFAISVVAAANGSVTLNWTAPTENEDGSPLTDLAGYRIYWGTTPGTYPNSITVDNPGVTTYVVNNLMPGTYEFVATAYNSEGVESRFSNTATKIVQ